MTFPSKEHQAALRDKAKAGGFDGLAADNLAQYHAYNYGWRRARLGDFSVSYPLDPAGEHYDARLCELAVEFYCRLAGRKYHRPTTPNRPAPTREQIAHVERCVAQIKANLAAADERNRAAFGGAFDEDREALRRVREALGTSATAHIANQGED